MNAKQINRLNMFEAVQAFMANTQTTWTSITAIGAAKLELDGKITAIRTERQKQEKDASGLVVERKTLRETLTRQTLKVSGALLAYASATNNAELIGIVDYTPSNFVRARDNIFYDMVRIIYEAATPLATQLAGYNIVAADLTLMQTQLTQFLTAIPKRRNATAVSKSATTAIGGLFKDADTILKNKLDRLVLSFRVTNPDFYTNYLNARIIVDLGAGKGTEVVSGAPVG
jgi:hypothetical protein